MDEPEDHGDSHVKQISIPSAQSGFLVYKIDYSRRFTQEAYLSHVVENMVRPERFELPTFWFVARRSIQLSYERTGMHCR
jgi:hypothetical protein